MTTIDLLLITALSIFALSWWLHSGSRRRLVLTACATIALGAGIVGVLDHRWQGGIGVAVAAILLVAVLVGRLRNRAPTTGLPWLSGSAVILLLLLTVAPLYLFPVTDLPLPSGEYPVGTRDFELTDPDRLGVFAAAPGEPRRLLVRTWYPAGNVAGMQRRPYFTDAEVDTTAAGLGGILGMPFLFQYTKHSTTHSYTNAPLAPGAKGLPVLFYSHGYTSFAGQNTALMEELASHGYVVYSIQHSYDAAPTLMPNGDVVPMDPAFIEMFRKPPELTQAMKQAFGGSTLDERYQGVVQTHRDTIETGDRIGVSAPIWLDDRLFVLNALQRLEVPETVRDVVSASNFTATGQLGMSFGGSTSGGVCMVDSRCVAGVNMDGADYHGTPFGRNLPVPFMMFYSDFRGIADMAGADANTPLRGTNDFSYERPELAGMRSDIYRLTTRDVKHLGISDFTLFVRNPIREMLFGSIDADAIIHIQNDFIRGFFDTHLRGLEVGFPNRQYTKHARWVARDDIGEVRQWWLTRHPEDTVERVVLTTNLGEIEIALYPKKAPAAANFLASVESGQLNDASLQRAIGGNTGVDINLIQGRLPAVTMGHSQETRDKLTQSLPSSVQQRTEQTGIANEHGTLSYARLESGAAGSQLFFNLQGIPAVDSDNHSHNPEGTGHAVFGRVMRGMRILEHAQAMPESDDATIQEQVFVLSSRRIEGS